MKNIYLKKVFLFTLLSGVTHILTAQNIFFSQYQPTPLLTNPASIASDDYLKGGIQWRRQNVGGSLAFSTPVITGVYPLVSEKTGSRWAAIGAEFFRDEAGVGGLLQTTGGALAFAYNFNLPKNHFISIGLQGGYFARRVNTNQLQTGAQWDGRQFNGSIADPDLTGSDFNTPFLSIESGVEWSWEDTLRQKRAFLGFSARQINQPDVSFGANGAEGYRLPLTFVATGGVTVFRNEQWSVQPNARYINQATQSQINAGVSVSYHLQKEIDEELNNILENRFTLNTWYSLDNALIAGIEANLKNGLFLNVSYDFTSVRPEKLGVPNSAIEFGIGYRKFLGKKKNKDKKEEPPILPVLGKCEGVDVSKAASETLSFNYTDPRSLDLNESQINLIQSSLLFTYNQCTLSSTQKTYLEKLATLLKVKTTLKLEISGHTCSLGASSEKDFLAKARAISVYDYLISKGIDKARLIPKGFSDTKPIAPNTIEAGRIRNRRVEFRIIE